MGSEVHKWCELLSLTYGTPGIAPDAITFHGKTLDEVEGSITRYLNNVTSEKHRYGIRVLYVISNLDTHTGGRELMEMLEWDFANKQGDPLQFKIVKSRSLGDLLHGSDAPTNLIDRLPKTPQHLEFEAMQPLFEQAEKLKGLGERTDEHLG